MAIEYPLRTKEATTQLYLGILRSVPAAGSAPSHGTLLLTRRETNR